MIQYENHYLGLAVIKDANKFFYFKITFCDNFVI